MRQRRAILILTVVLAAAGLVVGSPAGPAGADAATGSVAGTVTGDAGQGVAGVRVLVYDSAFPVQHQIARGVTAADGSYSLRGVATGIVEVCFDATDASDAPPEGYLGNCGTGFTWIPGSPPSANSIEVRAGRTARADSILDHAGGIAGVVTTTDGDPLGGVVVQVTDARSTVRATTAVDGSYHVRNLAPGDGPDRRVCFDPAAATGATSAGGWLGQCWDGRYWAGPRSYQPAFGDLVSVTADTATSGVDARLGPAATVSGVVRADDGGAPLGGLTVQVYSPTAPGRQLRVTTTAADGRYRVDNLPGADDYTLCVRGGPSGENPATAVLQAECWRDRTWDPDRDRSLFAADSTPIILVGGTARRFDIGLAATGHVAGTVTDSGAAPLAGVEVGVYRGTTRLGTATTDSAGHYDVPGLPPTTTGYGVCFLPSATTDAGHAGGYRAECATDRYVPLPFAVPSGVTPVAVPAGGTATVDAQLATGAAFAGKLTDAATGTPVADVPVLLLDPSGRELARQGSASNGRYEFTGLDPGVSYRVCALGLDTTGSTTAGRFASRCNGNVAWSGVVAAPTGSPLPGVAGGSTRVDLALTAGGAITGRTGTAGDRFELVVIDVDGRRVGTGMTVQLSRFVTTWSVRGLTPGSGPYRVCFADPGDVARPPSTRRYGIAATCWNGAGTGAADWDGALADLPAVATVPVTAGGTTTGIDGGTLRSAGAISGVVRAGADVSVGTAVTVFAPSGAVVGATTTVPRGYTVQGLNPATGPYRVCAAAPTGFGARCWVSAAWSGSGPPPAGAAVRAVTANQVTAGTDIRLARG